MDRFIHGGTAYDTRTDELDQIYILSLPAFHWFRAEYSPTNPRAWHTCHSVGNRQMILIGGLDPTKDSVPDAAFLSSPKDPWEQGIGVFDMSTLQWKSSYQASASVYARPEPVWQHYQKHGRNPPSTWSNPEVQRLFDSNSTTNPDSDPLPPPPNTKRNARQLGRGAVAGIKNSDRWVSHYNVLDRCMVLQIPPSQGQERTSG